MRHQEKIYSKSGVCVRNRDHFNVSMSSDICIFNAPFFDMTGADKIGSGTTSASTGVYIISDEEDIDLSFNFNYGFGSLSEDSLFKFEIYKYNSDQGVFKEQAVYSSDDYSYSGFSGTSAVTVSVPISDLSIDGDFLIKGYYEHGICTDILGRLNLRNDTSFFKSGSQYGLYNSSKDFYFTAISEAETPLFNGGNVDAFRPLGSLVARTILPDGGTTVLLIDGTVEGDLLIYLNGMLLAENLDYVKDGDTITLSGETIENDVITYVSVKNQETDGLVVDYIEIDSTIPNGPTDGEGSSDYFYNTTQNKYEIFTDLTPIFGNDIVVTLNGITLANNIDYYQSTSNPNRIILEGNLLMGDVINIIYNAYPQYVGEIYTNTPTIYWNIESAPQSNNGVFTLEASPNPLFDDIISSATTEYIPNQNSYSAELTITGSVGTNLVYRVVNDKNYVTLDGDIINSRAYSETVPITIMSNAINSY
jgi:hypothetical protein